MTCTSLVPYHFHFSVIKHSQGSGENKAGFASLAGRSKMKGHFVAVSRHRPMR